MTLVATLLPARRSDLVIRPIGDRGRYVIKLPGTGEFFQVGTQEHFLLMQLDGQQDAETACHAFIDRFGEALTEEEMLQFVEMARRKGLLQEERIAPEGTSGEELGSGETAPAPAAVKSQQ